MSLIGKQPVAIPSGVTITVDHDKVTIKGPKGELTVDVPRKIKVEVANDQVVVTRSNDEKETKALHGLVRSLINNQVIGVTKGFKKTLKLVGTGYRVTAKGVNLSRSEE